MLIKKICAALYIISYLGNCLASDITTANSGEKAMIASLREAINNDSVLKSVQDKIIIGAGVSGAEAFKSSAKQKELHVLLTWQWLDSFQDLAESTVLVVPSHSVDKRFKDLEKNKGVRLVTISGVLHTKTINKIKDVSVQKIDPSISYIVMLAGDAQQEDGSWVSYDRIMLNELLKSLPKGQNLLVLNGPRTGKYLEGTSVIDEFAHRTKTDYITQIVQNLGVARWTIVDFKYGEQSLWESALNFCMTNSNVGLILPGESTSMISEALSLGIRPIVYKHGAMTSTSYRYLDQLRQENRIFEYPADLGRGNYVQEPSENQLDKIVKALYFFVNQ